MEQHEAETLLAKLRESRLSTDERRTGLEAFRTAVDSMKPQELLRIITTAITDGPNDVRRVAFQTLSVHIEADLFDDDANKSGEAVNNLIEATETFLRTTLKLQNSKSTMSRSAVDVLSLPTSTLRATAAALKTLHALIRIAPRRAKSTSMSSQVIKVPRLFGLFEVLLPCLSAGSQTVRIAAMPLPRSSSTLQGSAFSWSEPPRQARSIRADAIASASRSTSNMRSEDSSAGETDRKSDKSESERSDFSTASIATTGSRSRKDESRQHEAAAKLIRQNALHCLVELNQHEFRALISHWSDLLPDQPAALDARSAASTSCTASRFSASSNSAAPFSLCTLITQDPSTSVRIAAMRALESILKQGTLQLSMAQERAQRALSFTSLSSQLAAWIVNIRSYLVAALQRAATAPRASTKAEGSAELVGYPSSLTVALLQLTRTFVVSTAKAKLVTANAIILGPAVVSFASHSDPQVQTAAKRLMATLTPPSSSPQARTQGGTQLSQTKKADSPASVDTAAATQASDAKIDIASLLGTGAVSSLDTCDRVLSFFAATEDPMCHLSSWSIFVKGLAESSAPVLGQDASSRLMSVWRRLCAQPGKTPEQQSLLLSSIPDYHAALSRCSASDESTSSSTLSYVERCCIDVDEAVRAAAVRVLGLLVLPADTSFNRNAQQQQAISKALDVVLFGRNEAAGNGALCDRSTLVRQRASWAFSNSVEARSRSGTPIDESEWIVQARYCFEAGKDIEGVAVSACRASGILLAVLPHAQASNVVCCSLGKSLLEQLCRVLGTTSKPPKSRWNAASALDRALGSDAVLTGLVDAEMLDKVVELLCSSLDAKVFKIRVSAANALVSLCKAQAQAQEPHADRLELLGEQRTGRIRRTALARLGELQQPIQSKESTLYLDELKRLLGHLVASIPSSYAS